ncbi:MAG: hypothetical protein ACRED1_01655 [Limisphaerales bacterium]
MMKRSLFLCLVVFPAAMLMPAQGADAALSRSAILEKNVAYLQIAGTDTGLANGIRGALNRLEATNTVAGIIVDLRFADGNDAGELPSIEHILERPKVPLAILINGQTAGASAKLAEELREENAGLVFGSAAGNFQPDIPVRTNAADQKKWLNNPYAVLPGSAAAANSDTNLLTLVDIDHTTEADLVREKIKDGEQDDSDAEPPTPKSFIHDPVLARGLDFIKGVAALHLTANP